MLIKIFVKLICFLFITTFSFADVINITNEQILKLSKSNIPIVDVRRNSEWHQTGVIPNSILLTFFDKNGNYNFEKWYEKLRLNINEEKPIILICRTGRRTKIIAEMMDKKLDNVIYNAKDGITSWIDAKNLNENGFANTGIKDRGFMDSIYFREPLGLLIELASYKFDPPIGFSHANVLEKAHKIRVKRKALNIQDEDIASAIKALRN